MLFWHLEVYFSDFVFNVLLSKGCGIFFFHLMLEINLFRGLAFNEEKFSLLLSGSFRTSFFNAGMFTTWLLCHFDVQIVRDNPLHTHQQFETLKNVDNINGYLASGLAFIKHVNSYFGSWKVIGQVTLNWYVIMVLFLKVCNTLM